MKALVHSLALLTIAATLAADVQADSLFPGSSTDVARNNSDSVSLFADNKARRVGDTLTVVITETGAASSVAETKTAKTEGLNYGPGFGPLLFNIKNFGLNGNINSDGSGSTTRTDNLTASIGVTVKQVLPNGNLGRGRQAPSRHECGNAEYHAHGNSSPNRHRSQQHDCVAAGRRCPDQIRWTRPRRRQAA